MAKDKADELTKDDLTLKVNYRPSDDIAAAVKSAKLSWASAEDEQKEQEQDGDAATTNPDDPATGGDGDEVEP